MVKQGRKESLRGRLRRAIGVATVRQVRGELTGARRFVVQGCDRILDFDERCIRLSLQDADLREMAIEGEALRCVSYHPDAIVITGRIGTITLWDREGRRED